MYIADFFYIKFPIGKNKNVCPIGNKLGQYSHGQTSFRLKILFSHGKQSFCNVKPSIKISYVDS